MSTRTDTTTGGPEPRGATGGAAEQTITLNGESHAVSAEATIADILRDMDLDPSQPKGIAVALNDDVVPKSAWFECLVEEGDRVEVITARQGG